MIRPTRGMFGIFFPSDRNCRLFVLVSCNGNIFISAFLEAAALLFFWWCVRSLFFLFFIFFLLPAIGQGRSRQTPATTSDDDRPSNRLNNFILEFFLRSMNIF
jgi:hypothetical protein